MSTRPVNETLIATIRSGDHVTILVPNGIGRFGTEWKEATGRAVMVSSHGGWVLNMGGKHGKPGIADNTNVVAVRKGRR